MGIAILIVVLLTSDEPNLITNDGYAVDMIWILNVKQLNCESIDLRDLFSSLDPDDIFRFDISMADSLLSCCC